ncbi:uncharacterized protein LOC132296600 [Cornus florida]|uniref:uncharacterized protein LOC132296600 n=1 Tax=Cornus florida TaxID=4283 RepID=UPI00289E63DD|nr:uncharacterized protein LOC132296600 [Cornus florida]
MEERETVAEYMFRINDLVNNMRALGEDIKDVDVKIDELQASLTAYEMRIGVPVVHRRETALKAKEVVEETETETKSKDDLEEDEVAYLAKKFRKFRFKKKNQLQNLTCYGYAILEALQIPIQVEEDSDTKIEEILEECERLAVKWNFKVTRMYMKKSNIAQAQKVKNKDSIVKSSMMWIPKKLNSVNLLMYTAFKACNKVDKWYIDSGCSRHMTGDGSKFITLKQFDYGDVIFGDNQKAKIVGIGTVSKSEELPKIQEVLLVEGLKQNLLSVSQLCDNGRTVCFEKEKCNVVDLKSKQVLFSACRSSRNVYIVTEEFQATQCNLTTYDEANLWHKKLGHLHSRNLSKILKLKAVKRLPELNFKDDHL